MSMALAGGMAAGSLASSIIGAHQSAEDREMALAMAEAALNEYLAINVPDPQKQQLILERYRETGQLAPEIEQAVRQEVSAQTGIDLDPTTRDAQISALNKLTDITQNQGLDAQAKAQLQQIKNQTNSNEQGQREAIVQGAARKGRSGSGASLAAMLQAQQSGADRESQGALDINAMGADRALQALVAQGSLGGNIRSQDYQQELNAANAQDAINQFNAQNANQAMRNSVQARNAAQAANLASRQEIANQNVGVANYQQEHNAGLQQQNFQNQLALAGAKANARLGVGTQHNNNAQATANQWGGISTALATGAGALAKYGMGRKALPEADDDGGYYSSSTAG